MIGSLTSGLSGIRANQSSMEVIGNNIANANTVGFKSARATFSDVLSRTIRNATLSTNPIQVGRGVQVASVTTINSQGGLQESALASDLALQGRGYFIVNDGERDFYTRAGNFTVDNQGRLVTADGMTVQGFNAVGGIIPVTAVKTAITLPTETIPPKATSAFRMGGNLDAGGKVFAKDSNGNDVLIGGTDRIIGTALNGTANLTDNGTTITVTTQGANLTGLNSGDTFIVGGRRFTIQDAPTDSNGDNIPDTLTLARPELEGTISVAANSRNVLGVGTAFRSELRVGDTIVVDGNDVKITKILSDTELEIASPALNPVANAELSFGTTAGVTGLTAARMETSVVPAGTTRLTDIGGSNFPISLQETANILIRDKATGRVSVVAIKGSNTLDEFTAAVRDGGLPTYAINSDDFELFKLDPENGRSVSFQLVDSQGNPHTAIVSMFRTDAPNEWAWTMRVPDAETLPQDASFNFGLNSRGTLVFNDDGTLSAFRNAAGSDRFTLQFNAQTGTQPFAVEMTRNAVEAITQYDLGGSELVLLSNDGIRPGQFESFSVEPDGRMIGTFSNGDTRVIGQVLIASFKNDAGLQRVGASMFSNTIASGDAIIGTAWQSGTGSILSNALELSNVDLADQFTQMILAQRGFQSSANVITTTDTILQDLLNLKRG